MEAAAHGTGQGRVPRRWGLRERGDAEDLLCVGKWLWVRGGERCRRPSAGWKQPPAKTVALDVPVINGKNM